jgi:hypothetical protein
VCAKSPYYDRTGSDKKPSHSDTVPILSFWDASFPLNFQINFQNRCASIFSKPSIILENYRNTWDEG